MKVNLLAIVMVIFTGYGHLLYAQNGVDPAVEPSSSAKQSSSSIGRSGKTSDLPDKPVNSKQTRSADKVLKDVFIPTEEISEDRPVAFPVDI